MIYTRSQYLEIFERRIKKRPYEQFSLLLCDIDNADPKQLSQLNNLLFGDVLNPENWINYVEYVSTKFPNKSNHIQRLLNKSFECIDEQKFSSSRHLLSLHLLSASMKTDIESIEYYKNVVWKKRIGERFSILYTTWAAVMKRVNIPNEEILQVLKQGLDSQAEPKHTILTMMQQLLMTDAASIPSQLHVPILSHDIPEDIINDSNQHHPHISHSKSSSDTPYMHSTSSILPDNHNNNNHHMQLNQSIFYDNNEDDDDDLDIFASYINEIQPSMIMDRIEEENYDDEVRYSNQTTSQGKKDKDKDTTISQSLLPEDDKENYYSANSYGNIPVSGDNSTSIIGTKRPNLASIDKAQLTVTCLSENKTIKKSVIKPYISSTHDSRHTCTSHMFTTNPYYEDDNIQEHIINEQQYTHHHDNVKKVEEKDDENNDDNNNNDNDSRENFMNIVNQHDILLEHQIKIGNQLFLILDILGKGGSAIVYKILSLKKRHQYALKKIKSSTHEEYQRHINEVKILEHLKGCNYVIQFIYAEIDESKYHIQIITELADCDLSKIIASLSSTTSQHCNITEASFSSARHYIRYLWTQMLLAVHEVHSHHIIHGDLKPSNFVLVKGQVKLIDFGIATSFATSTTTTTTTNNSEIQQANNNRQVGTINYMSPETLCPVPLKSTCRSNSYHRPLDHDVSISTTTSTSTSSSSSSSSSSTTTSSSYKLTTATDIWSLGCILYQMIYSRPPFAHLNTVDKLKAIVNPHYIITYPSSASSSPLQDDDAIYTMKSCLQRNPNLRATIAGTQGLLSHRFINSTTGS